MAGLIGIGQSALMAAYAQLQTTGHNIANANTPGYSRQEAVFATATGLQTGAGFMGSGVDLVTVQRRYDRFLSGELSSQTAAAAAAGTRAEMLGRIDSLLADTDNGLGVAFDEFGAAMADVINRPSDPAARQAVIMRADSLAQRLRGIDSDLRQLGQESDRRIAQSTGSVNQLLDGIARLNERIAQAGGSGHTPNDLLDERDALVLQLNGYLKATTYTQADGTVSVFAAGGEGLVVGNRASKLVAEPDPADSSRQRVVLEMGATRLPMNEGSLGGGSLSGLLKFRDGDLQAARVRLGQLAAGLAEAFNRQHAAGIDANGAPGGAMFTLGSAEVIAAAGNVGNASIAARVVDGTAVAASDYAIRYDGVRYTVTRLSDGVSSQHDDLTQTVDGVTGPLSIDGLEFELQGGPPAGGDSFVVRSASSFAAGFANALSSGTQLAAGHAMTTELPAGNTGDLSSDNRNARAMLALADRPIAGGATFTDAFGELLVDAGTRVESAQAMEAVSQRLLQDAQAAQASHSAVNLDEEAARLMQYQQMYQAAARVIQAAQSMFDALLSATAR